MKKRIAILSLMCMLTISCAVGCNNKEKSKVTTNKNGAVVTEKKVLEPGVEYTAKLGEEFNYEKKNIDIKFLEISQTVAAKDDTVNYAFVFQASNNGSEDVTIWMLDDFKLTVDGKLLTYNEMFSALSAANGAMAYPDYKKYDATLAPGESITGFVPFQITGDWQNMIVEYTPDSENSNDYIHYEISHSDVVNKF